MLLASFLPPVKGEGLAGKVAIKGVKAAETAADVSKLVSQVKYVIRYDKVMPALQAVYHQVVKGTDYPNDPLVQTAMGTTSQKCRLCPTGIVASRRWSWSGVRWTDDRNRG
jgi:hypothetical protein